MTARYDDTATLLVPTETDPPIQAIDGRVAATLRELPAPERLRAVLVAHELAVAARARCSAPYVVRLSVVDRCRTLEIVVDDATVAEGAEPDDAGARRPVGCPAAPAGPDHVGGADLRRRAPALLPPHQPRPGTGHRRAG